MLDTFGHLSGAALRNFDILDLRYIQREYAVQTRSLNRLVLVNNHEWHDIQGNACIVVQSVVVLVGLRLQIRQTSGTQGKVLHS